MIIFKGKILMIDWTENFIPGTTIKMTPKGYMATEVSIH